MTTPDALLTPQEAADYLRLPVRQLQQWRYLGTGPAYTKAGRAVRYYRSDLDAWLKAQRVEPRGAP
jgi:excisionase family DNA binding protein